MMNIPCLIAKFYLKYPGCSYFATLQGLLSGFVCYGGLLQVALDSKTDKDGMFQSLICQSTLWQELIWAPEATNSRSNTA